MTGTVAAIGLLTGVVCGLFANIPSVTVGHDGLSVTRFNWGTEQTFTLGWTVIERVTLGGSDADRRRSVRHQTVVMVWFREGRAPSEAWLSEHRLRPRKDGSYSLYEPGADDGYPPAYRFHEPLRTFAGPLYDAPDSV
ncbi:hypothetical protein O1L60_21170 [Streptomyces diastatochromogenes]|nr:hypothetical protein [Streptomyces diastatochromogenes]